MVPLLILSEHKKGKIKKLDRDVYVCARDCGQSSYIIVDEKLVSLDVSLLAHEIDNATSGINSSCRLSWGEKGGQPYRTTGIPGGGQARVQDRRRLWNKVGLLLAAKLVRSRECEKFTESKVHGWDRPVLKIYMVQGRFFGDNGLSFFHSYILGTNA